ncbi:MAG TPA: LacI family DNA-binding transcriptional regulator [Stellaceae bacterium]|nr:LacI family DNA-binding transcriptional regulator [Stellaceae bacterium]
MLTGKRRPTIRDVAKAAEVSVGTVSAVINGSVRVTESTRTRILQCISELGYEPNTAARSLKRQRSSSIGLIVPDLQNPFFAAVAEGAHVIAQRHDVLMVLGTTGAESRWEEYYAQTLRARRLDGMILLSGSGKPNVGLVKLVESGSVVFVDECVPGLDAPFISATNRTGARQVAHEIMRVGHRNIAIVAGPPWLWTSQQRLAGYREALAAAGHDPDRAIVASGDYTEESGYHVTRNIFESMSGENLTAILYANDLMAFGGARFLRETDKEIPYDVSIVGFDDITSSRYFSPPLTTVAQPGYEMGKAAAQLLLAKLGLSDVPETTIFSTELKIRNSVAPPRSSLSVSLRTLGRSKA